MTLGDYSLIENLEEAKLTVVGLIVMLLKVFFALLAFLLVDHYLSLCCTTGGSTA